MYYYHAVCEFNRYSDDVSAIHWWSDFSKEEIISEVVLPFIRKQIVKCHLNGDIALLNLGQTKYLRIYRTRKTLTDEQIEKIENNNPVGADCTERILNEIKFENASNDIKSLLAKSIMPLKHQLFVTMKFGDELLESAYKGVIRPIAEEFGYHVLRIDEIQDSGMITNQIIEHIAESELILADLTGARPNCYYETGVAYALGKELILTIKKGERAHFDLSVYRFIEWKTEHELRLKLRERFNSVKHKKSGGGLH